MKNRDIYWKWYKIQETLYTRQGCLVLLKAGTLGPRTVLPITISCPVTFSWKISSLSKVISVLGKARNHSVPNLGCRGAESPGWFHVWPKSSAWDVMHEQVCCCNEAANYQLPIVAAFWIIQIVSAEEYSGLTQNLTQVCCSISSVILNVTVQQYKCSLNSVSCPHWLVQWSRHCSCMRIPVHSPWLSGYTHVTQSILILLTMVGFFQRPCKLKCPHLCNLSSCIHTSPMVSTIKLWQHVKKLCKLFCRAEL